ncbi:DUF4907 domain-containing protein [Chitinophaga vietnamensis]|uniref:DUF4907 domain-containing protein n=1 Tax=Chitinophaga vietnamensis TaxID=2593957 RepID=UPI001375A314|nr:DUF4907 domain-containing protein [Chitinophaga vietnamensis]
MTKRNLLIIAGIALLILAILFRKPTTVSADKSSGAMMAVAVEPFAINGGWGYKVNMDGHTYIYQDVIPGIQGNHVFRSKEEAVRVGNAVVAKLSKHQIPSMSEEELRQMNINF